MRHDEAEPRHPIRVVAQRTGLTPATLRAWERRYGVVEPGRSGGGQRLYSDRDVQRLIRLRRLTDHGRAISLVAELEDQEAEALLAEDLAARVEPTAAGAVDTRAAPGVVEAAYRYTQALDAEGLEACLRRGAVTLGARAFLEDVVGPLLRRVGTAWSRRELTPAHEHLCTAVTERVLAWLSGPAPASAEAPRIVVATLPGERHGLGALLVAATAALEGWQVTYLGVDLPAGDVADAAADLGARLVALSLVNVTSVEDTIGHLAELRRGLPAATLVVLGGAGAQRLAPARLPVGVEVVPGLAGLREVLAR